MKYLSAILTSCFFTIFCPIANGIISPQPVTLEELQSEEEKPVTLGQVELQPSFPGGDAEMYKFLAANIKYPATAAEEGVTGRVIVTFIVEKDGSLSNVKVLRGKHPDLDKEAIRIVKAMPKWIPGKRNNEVVRVSYNLPITFKF